MDRHALCPASYKASAGYPVHDSRYSKDGTQAHEALEWCLSRSIPKAEYMENHVGSPIHTWEHNTDTRQIRLDAIQDVLDHVYDIIDGYGDAVVHFEKRVHFNSMYTDDCWGTADIIIVIPSMGFMYVIDFKYGAGVYVEVIGNKQIRTYSVAAYDAFKEGFNIVEVTNTIIQPRARSVSNEWVRVEILSAQELDTTVRYEIEDVIVGTMADDAAFVPGKKQCQFCPRRADCPAREAAALSAASVQFKNIRSVEQSALIPPEHLSLDQIAFTLSKADLLRAYLKDVERAAYAHMMAGNLIPGYKLVMADAKRVWHYDGKETVQTLSMLLDKPENELWRKLPPTITEAERLVVNAFKENAPKGQKRQAAIDAKSALANLTTKESSGKLRIAPVDHPAPGVDVMKSNFAQIQIPAPPGTDDDEGEDN